MPQNHEKENNITSPEADPDQAPSVIADMETDHPGERAGKKKKRLTVEDTAPVTEHLSELRIRILVALIALIVTSTAAFIINPKVMEFFAMPIGSLYFFGPSDAFTVRLKLSALIGAILAAPVILLELWLFVKPGLYDSEQQYARPIALISIFLFYCGIAFGLQVLPLAIKVLVGFRTEVMEPAISLKNFISFASFLLISFGVVFQTPIILLFLTRFNIIALDTFKKNRKIVIVVNLCLAAILTPVDVVTMMMMFIPLMILFEIGIIVSGFYLKNIKMGQKEARETAEGQQ